MFAWVPPHPPPPPPPPHPPPEECTKIQFCEQVSVRVLGRWEQRSLNNDAVVHVESELKGEGEVHTFLFVRSQFSVSEERVVLYHV